MVPGPAAIFAAGFFIPCFLVRGLSWGPRVLSKHLVSLQLVSWACSDLRRCFFYFCFLARSLSWLSWDSRVLGKHLGTRYNCSPGMPRSLLLVFLRLPSSLVVSPGSPGVLGCLAGTWGLSTIAPRACRALRRWLFTNLLARWLVGPHLALPPRVPSRRVRSLVFISCSL